MYKKLIIHAWVVNPINTQRLTHQATPNTKGPFPPFLENDVMWYRIIQVPWLLQKIDLVLTGTRTSWHCHPQGDIAADTTAIWKGTLQMPSN